MDKEDERASLMRMTVAQLREVARAEGICLGYDAARKDTMVNAIVSQRWHVEREAAHGRDH